MALLPQADPLDDEALQMMLGEEPEALLRRRAVQQSLGPVMLGKPPEPTFVGPTEPVKRPDTWFDKSFDLLMGALGLPGVPNTEARQAGEFLSAGLPLIGAAAATVGRAKRGVGELETVLSDVLKTKPPKAQPTVPHLERAPVTTIDDRLLVSNRVPRAVDAPASSEVLHTGLPEVQQVPEVMSKMATRLRDDPMVRKPGRTDEGVLEKFIDTAQSNYEYLIKQMSQWADRSKKWYDSAHAVSRNLADTHGISQDQASGVIAVLSPQKDWHQNAEEARNAIRTYTELKADKIPFTKELADQYTLTSTGSEARNLEKKVREGKITQQQALAQRANTEMLTRLRMESMNGRVWSELSREDQAVMMRAYSELTHGQQYPILSPEGGIAQAIARNQVPPPKPGKEAKLGVPSKLSWNQYADLEKVIQILDDGSALSISQALGNEHKVRSFFNNINHPNYGLQMGERGASTIDTHAVAGGHLQPFSQDAPPARYAMGGVKDLMSGLSGSNALYQEALTRAGRSHGLLPREAQSISWEGLKGLFDPGQKSNAQLQALMEKLWRDYNKGKQSLGSVQDAILNEAGGITAPAWARPPQ